MVEGKAARKIENWPPPHVEATENAMSLTIPATTGVEPIDHL